MINRDKLKKYDLLECVTINQKCPKCGKKLEISLTGFKSAGFKYGLIYQCPNCYADFYISDVKLEEIKK